jgi:hypothetical protein
MYCIVGQGDGIKGRKYDLARHAESNPCFSALMKIFVDDCSNSQPVSLRRYLLHHATVAKSTTNGVRFAVHEFM